jgi:hypothetical protein
MAHTAGPLFPHLRRRPSSTTEYGPDEENRRHLFEKEMASLEDVLKTKVDPFPTFDIEEEEEDEGYVVY